MNAGGFTGDGGVEFEVDFPDAENAGDGMSVTGGIATGTLIIDRRHHGEAAAAVRTVDDALACAKVASLQELRIGMADGAGFVLLGDAGVDLGRICGKGDLTIAVEHANTVDALFEGDGFHDLVGIVPAIGEHRRRLHW